MVTPQGPKVVEYNARFGDPETQVVLPRLDSDLLEILLACAEGRLSGSCRRSNGTKGACATVVWASAGYPASADKGRVIEGLDEAAASPGALLFHAGTGRRDGVWSTQGGRVLAVSGLGQDLAEALKAAYAAGSLIHFDGMQYRRDIGHRALARG